MKHQHPVCQIGYMPTPAKYLNTHSFQITPQSSRLRIQSKCQLMDSASKKMDIYAREGAELERSTLADWVGGTSALLEPLLEALRRHVMSATKLHADDTPVPVLAPGNGKTGRLWTYVRDDRPAGDTTPAV